MIKLEELKGKTNEEVGELLQKSSEEYVKIVENLEMSELNDQEAILVSALEEYDNYLNNTTYLLPKRIQFENESYTKEDVAGFIVEFINKQEVEWSYSLGLFQMIQYWNKVCREKTDSYIEYKVYDSVLRLLGGMKFKGYQEWKNILVVNEFMTEIQHQYITDTSYLIYLSKLHNTVLDRMQKLNNPEPIMESENI